MNKNTYIALLIPSIIYGQSLKQNDQLLQFLNENSLKFNNNINLNNNYELVSTNDAQVKKTYGLNKKKKLFGFETQTILIDTIDNKLHSVSFWLKNADLLSEKLVDALKNYKFIKSSEYSILWRSENFSIELITIDKNDQILKIEYNYKIKLPNLRDAKDAIQRYYKSIVSIIAFDENQKEISRGSGVFWGLGVLTNFHVVENSNSVKIFDNNSYYTVSRIEKHENLDLAYLTCQNGLDVINKDPTISNNYQQGQKVYAIGNPLGLERSISEGIVSGIRFDDGRKLIQTTAPISPGSSGGGLFNDNGELIGITTATLVNGQNLNFAIPLNDVSIIKFKNIENLVNKSQNNENSTKSLENIKLEFDMGNFEKGIILCQNELRKDQKSPAIWFYLGYAQRRTGKFANAIISQNKAIEFTQIPRQRIGSYRELILLYLATQQKENAQECYNVLKQLDPDIAQKYYNDLAPIFKKDIY